MIQQLREAFPYDSAPGYLIFDRGQQFNNEAIETQRSFGIHPKRTNFRSPSQNGVAETLGRQPPPGSRRSQAFSS